MLGARQYGEVLKNYIKAGSQSCSPELLEVMAHSEIERIRRRIAENPCTPKEILEILATDKSPEVRVAVGTNPSTPPDISYRLAFDQDLNVRLGLADDITTPLEILETLTEDVNPYVSSRAVQTKEIVLSQGKPRSFGQQLIRWFGKGANDPAARYA